MPLFDFICRSCGEEFETLVMGSEKPVCPKCKGSDLEKQMSTFAFRSGSGRSGGSSGTSGGGSKCSGCSAGSCSTCH